MLSPNPQFECVGFATNGNEAFDLASRMRPHIVIMDMTMPVCSGLDATRRLAAHVPETKVLAFSMRPDAASVVAALRAGASGYVSKTSPTSVLVEAIRALAEGKRFIDPSLTDKVVKTFLDEHVVEPAAILSKREHEVLLRVAEGFTSVDIAAEFNLSAKTVDCYKTRACQKMSLQDRPAIVRFALMSGWLNEAAR